MDDDYEIDYNSDGPCCPYCGFVQLADEPEYFDEDMKTLDCPDCNKEFKVWVHTETTWSTGMMPPSNPD